MRQKKNHLKVKNQLLFEDIPDVDKPSNSRREVNNYYIDLHQKLINEERKEKIVEESDATAEFYTTESEKEINAKTNKGSKVQNKNRKMLHGKDKILDYFHKAKNVQKVKDQEVLTGKSKDPLTEFLSEMDQKKEFPKSLGLVNYKGETDNINLKSFYMGDRYASAFSKGIKENTKIKKINLSRNNLEDEGFQKILESLPETLESIDLSHNDKLSLRSFQLLSFFLDDPMKRYPNPILTHLD